MKNRNELRRAAMAALVAAALMAGAGQAGASVYRFPEDAPSRLLAGRAKRVDDGSGGIASRVRLMLTFVRPRRDAGWEGIPALGLPAKKARSTN